MFMSFLNKEKTPLDWLGEVKQDSSGQNFLHNANDTTLRILLSELRESIATNFSNVFIKDEKFNILFGNIRTMKKILAHTD